MTSRDFCYWLQGYFEVNDVGKNNQRQPLSVDQVDCIKRHLSMVFAHEIDPSMGDEQHQHNLNNLHEHGLSDVYNQKPNRDEKMRC
jgi:hypothetical protein